MMNIENPMVTYIEPEPKICDKCDLCGQDILEGDNMYDMPDGTTICEGCLDAWAKYYKKTAMEE